MAFDFESLLAGPSEKDKQAALTQGLLAAGLGMLSNNRSKNAGMAIGQGGLLGLQAYQGSLGQSRQEAMQRLQMAMMADKVRKEREAEQRWNNFVGGQVSPTAALAQGAQVGDIGPTVTNAERMNQGGDEIFPGVPRQYLQQLGPQAGQALLAKILEDQAKMTEFDKLTRGMPRKKRDLALDTKLNIAPRPIQQDFGGSIGFGTIDPRNGMPTFAGNMPKTAAPGARPAYLNPDGTINQTVYGAEQGLRRAGATNVNVDARERDRRFEQGNQLRDDLKNDPRIKAADEMSAAFKLIEAARSRPSPANDLAMATKYMKILDPASVVRESELAMAMNASGLFDRVTNYAQMVLNGNKLTPKQREDFYNSAKAINDSFQVGANSIIQQYQSAAQRYNLDPQDVTLGRNSGASAPGAPMSDAEQAELARLRAWAGKRQ